MTSYGFKGPGKFGPAAPTLLTIVLPAQLYPTAVLSVEALYNNISSPQRLYFEHITNSFQHITEKQQTHTDRHLEYVGSSKTRGSSWPLCAGNDPSVGSRRQADNAHALTCLSEKGLHLVRAFVCVEWYWNHKIFTTWQESSLTVKPGHQHSHKAYLGTFLISPRVYLLLQTDRNASVGGIAFAAGPPCLWPGSCGCNVLLTNTEYRLSPRLRPAAAGCAHVINSSCKEIPWTSLSHV